MNVLLTGGSGKIGGYVLRALLSNGHVVTNYSRTPPFVQGVPHIQGDITDLDAVRPACRGRDAIVHLAAVPGPGITSPERLMYVNVRGTYNVLEAAMQEGVRKVVFGSSNAAMNNNFADPDTPVRYLPIDEEHPSEPRNEYGVSKLVNEITCRRYSDVYGLQTICLRINHNWYLDRAGVEMAVRSGWSKDRAVEEQWNGYRRAVESQTVSGNLWAVTDARDAAQAFRLALENEVVTHEVLLINGDDTHSLVETPELVERFYPDVPIRAPLDGHASLVSHEKATRVLGYRPDYTWRVSDFEEWRQEQQRRS